MTIFSQWEEFSAKFWPIRSREAGAKCQQDRGRFLGCYWNRVSESWTGDLCICHEARLHWIIPTNQRLRFKTVGQSQDGCQSMISWQKLQVWQMSILSQVERFLWLVSFPFLRSLLRFQTRKGTWYFCVLYELKVNITTGLCHCWLLSLYLVSTILGCYLSILWVLRNLNLNIPVIVRQTLNPVSSLYLERSHRY